MVSVRKAAAVARLEQQHLFPPAELHRMITERAWKQFEAQGIDLDRLLRIETELKETSGNFWSVGAWEVHVRIEFEEDEA